MTAISDYIKDREEKYDETFVTPHIKKTAERKETFARELLAFIVSSWLK